MSRTTIETRVTGIIVDHLGVSESEIRPEVRLCPAAANANASFGSLGNRSKLFPEANEQDLGADSLDVVELVMTFEEEFSVEITDDEAEKFVTVKDIFDLIESKVG